MEPVDGASSYIPSREEALSVLFVGVSPDSLEAEAFLLARFDPARGRVPIVAFPRETAVRNREKTESLAQVYRYGGADYARRALEDTVGVPIDRYVRMDQSTFLVVAATIGSVEFDLPVAVSLGEGTAGEITLSPGAQLLDGPKVAALLAHPYPGGELERCRVAGEVAAAIVNQRMDVALSAVVDKVFEKIVNLVDTDISYPDYDDRKEAAAFLARLSQDPGLAIPVEGSYREGGALYQLTDTFVALLTQTFA